jgi:hypothetical protein
MTTVVIIYELGLIVIIGLAFFWIIWDCARKNYKEIVNIMVENEELDLAFKAEIIKYLEMNGYDAIGLRSLLEKQEMNRDMMKKHSL